VRFRFCHAAKLESAVGSSCIRPKRGRQAPAGPTEEAGGPNSNVDPAAAAPQEAGGGSSGAVDHAAAALAAGNTLTLSLNAAEADAANEQAITTVLPLLRPAPASESTRVQVVHEGLKQLHAAAVKGERAGRGWAAAGGVRGHQVLGSSSSRRRGAASSSRRRGAAATRSSRGVQQGQQRQQQQVTPGSIIVGCWPSATYGH
jgi:hypothetical protein